MNVRTTLFMLAVATAPTVAILSQPPEASFPPNRLYVAAGGSSVVEVDVRSLPTPVTGLPANPGQITGLPVVITGLAMPDDLLFGPDGLLYVTERAGNRVLGFDASGAALASIGVDSGLDDPTGLAFGPRGGMYVSSFASDRVLAFDRDGQLIGEIGSGSGLDGPTGLAVAPNGHLYVSSYFSDQVLIFDTSGILVGEIGGADSLTGPWGLAFGRSGRLYVTSSADHRVRIFDSAGAWIGSLGTDALLDTPIDVVFGPDGKAWVTSAGHDMVVRFDNDGTGYILVPPDLGLQSPRGLAFAPWLMKGNFKARYTADGGEYSKDKDKQLLFTIAPGSGTVGILMDQDGDVFPGTFAADALVFHGFESYKDADSDLRLTHAGLVLDAGPSRALATLLLELRGDVVAHPVFDGEFRPFKSRDGLLQFGSNQGVAQGTLKLKPLGND